MTRRESIILLLGSLHDHLPSLGSNFKPTRGLVAAVKRPCPDCGHTEDRGWIRDRWGKLTACVTCGGSPEPTGNGRTWLKKDAGRGWIAVDPMDTLEAPVSSATATAPPTRPARVVDCDACAASGVGKPHLDDLGREYRDPCQRCGGSGKRTVTSFTLDVDQERGGAPLDKLTAAMIVREKAGSYHELDQALAALTRGQRNLVLDVHGPNGPLGPDAMLTLHESVLLDRALTSLEERMPDPIRVPGYLRQAEKRRRDHLRSIKGRGTSAPALAARDKEIRKLARQGRPTQWVAREYGLSVSQANRVIRGEAEAA